MSSKKSSKKTFSHFSFREQKVIVRYLYYQDIDSSETHKLLTATCGEDAPSYKDVRDWIKDIVEGREEIDDCVCMGGRKINELQPSNLTNPALVVRLENLLNADSRISAEKLAELCLTSSQSIQTILFTVLGLKRIYQRWVPRIWTPEQRKYRMIVCRQLLGKLKEKGSDMLKRIVVGDASYVLYHSVGENSVSVNNSSTNETQLPINRYKDVEEFERVYCAFFFDTEGMLVAEPLPNRNPLSAEEYADVLRDYLIPAIVRKREPCSEPIYLLHSDAPEQTAPIIQDTLTELNITILPNAVASPDLEPFEYWLYRHLTRALEELHFTCRDEVWSAVQKQMHGLTDMEYSNSIERLPKRWKSCIEKNGLYLL